jgi:hypothetical protein
MATWTVVTSLPAVASSPDAGVKRSVGSTYTPNFKPNSGVGASDDDEDNW